MTIGTTTLTSKGSIDAYVAKFDAQGNSLWAKSFGGTSNDYANSVAVDASGNAFVAGDFFSSSMTIGSTTLTVTSNTYSDAFIAKL